MTRLVRVVPVPACPTPKLNMLYVGIDNGVTSRGIGVVGDAGHRELIKLPVKKELSYTKEAKHITRIDMPGLLDIFKKLKSSAAAKLENRQILVGMERPMVNSTRFNASMSAIRALEATLIALEMAELAYEYYDSKQWQRVMLPKNITGSTELKKASLEVGKRLFPNLKLAGDADGLLMATWMQRTNNRQL